MIPLVFCTTHIYHSRHTYFTLKPSVYVPNYLNVTLPINDILCDDMLLEVTDSNPWYTNIVNFMFLGYVPPRENKKKLSYESRCHLWDDPYLYKVCTDDLL
jgi:hypothetical protein